MDSAQPRAAPAGVPVDDNKRMMLFSGRGNPALGAAIADELGVELGAVTLKTFSAGESYCRFDESVRGADVFIVQSTCDNASTDVRTNHALMELLLMIDAAVGASAHRVIAVMPWFAYSRQDKKSELREPISARLVAHMLETAGVDRVLAVDLHAGQVQGFFTKPLDHATAMYLIADYFTDLQFDDLVVVAPDVGRVKLNNKFADKLGADLALMTKERPAQQVAEIGYLIGDVRGKTALIIDDIIDSGGTLAAAGETVLAAGAKCVYAAATHALFSGNAHKILAEGPFEQIVVTDTVPLRDDAPDNVVQLSLAPLLAESITNIFTNRPISEVFQGQNQPF